MLLILPAPTFMQLSPTFILLIHLLTYHPFSPYIAMNQSYNIIFMSAAPSLSSFRQSLNLHADPVQTAHYYTLIGSDFNIWPHLTARLGFYTMTNPIFQSALLRRLNLSQPTIPAGLTCACARKPIIDTLGRHFTTGCALHDVRQSTERSIVDSVPLFQGSCHQPSRPPYSPVG